MKTYASHGGTLYPLAKTYADNETLPQNRELISYCAEYANPTDNYAHAATCTLYRVPGVGYIAAGVRPYRHPNQPSF